ncbi:MAG: ABC transporter substrate-binding protein [Thermodesulfobacteriota bacterium]|nr:ABC transporter substrate-binding protein [Thermodesulfobacteriota bacterium]
MVEKGFFIRNTIPLLGVMACIILTFSFPRISLSEDVRGVTDTTVKIACIADQTGPAAGAGIMLGEAPKHLIRYVNENGGINGREIKYYLEDGRYSIPVGIAAFKKLVFKDQVLAMMGPYNTGTIKALFGQIEKLQVPNVAAIPQPSAVTPIKRNVFVTGEFYDDDFGVIFDYMLNELKLKDPKIAFCTYAAESGREVKESIDKWAKLFQIKHPIHKEIIPMGALEVASQVMSMKRKGITHILVHHPPPGSAALLRGLRKFGVHVPVFGDLLACTEDMVNLASGSAKNFIGAHGDSSWFDSQPGVKNLREITLKYIPKDDKAWRTRYYTMSWIATMTLLEGIKRTGKDCTPSSLVKGLESMKDFDTGGLCGPITYSPTDHKGISSCRLFKVDASTGKLTPFTGWKDPPKF